MGRGRIETPLGELTDTLVGLVTRIAVCYLFIVLGPSLAQADGFTLRRADANKEPIEQRMAQGKDVAWLLLRRTPSARWSTSVDGVIVMEADASLRIKAIRRENGDHRILFGYEGRPGEPIEGLRNRLPEIRSAHLVPYRLLTREGLRELAVLYAPHGAILRVAPHAEGVLIDLELPWDTRSLLNVQGTRAQDGR